MKVYFLITISIFFISCSENEKKEKTNVEIDIRGKWNGDRNYINEYFDVSAEIPEEWYLDKRKNRADTATNFLSGGDENLKATFKAAIEKTYSVFDTSIYPPGTPGKKNANAGMLIENLKHLQGITSAKDYLLVLEDTLSMTKRNFTFKTEPTKSVVGGVEFWKRELTLSLGKLEIKQTFHAKMKGGYILCFVTTIVASEAEENKSTVSQLNQIIRTI